MAGADAPVPESKLRVPPLSPVQIRRPLLVKRILRDFESGRQTLLISAPAGYGKTSMAADLAASMAPMRSAWLTLDQTDADPLRFYSHVAAAIERSGAGACTRVRGMLRSGQMAPIGSAASALSDDVWDAEEPFLLVIDDFHAAAGEHAAGAVYALASVPPRGLRLVVASRSDPDLPLDLLRARNRLAEIRAADLAFSTEEVRGYLRDSLGLLLGTEEAERLREKTEGWAAGIQLAGLAIDGARRSAREPEDAAVSRFIASMSGGHQYIISFLAEEVLKAQPEDVTEFLFKTSVLEDLCPELCDAVMGRPGSEAMLSRLLRANLFIVPADGGNRWFRYHALFAEALRGLAGKRGGLEASHRAASAWFEANGRPDLAVDHAWAGGDEDGAVRITEAESLGLMTRGYSMSAEAWINRIPPERLRGSPRAILSLAWIHAQRGALDMVRSCLEMAAAAGGDSPYAAEWLALKSKTALVEGKLQEAREYADRAGTLVRGSRDAAGALVRMTLAETYRAVGDDARTRVTYGEIIDGGRASGDAASELLGLSGLIQTAIFRGRLAEAEELSLRGVGLIERHALFTPLAAACHGTLAQVNFFRFRIEEAHRHFMAMLAAGMRGGSTDGEIYYSTFRSRLLLCEGDVEGADREITKAADALQSARIRWFDDDVLAQWSLVRLAQGRRAEAEARLADRGFGKNGVLEAPRMIAGRGLFPGILHAAALRVLVSRAADSGDAALLGECAQSAGELAETALAAPKLDLAIELTLLRARARSIAGDARACREDYRRALELAEPEGYVYPFVQEGKSALEALRGLSEHRAGSGFIGRVMACVSSAGPAAGAPPFTEALTRREREVLSFMAKGLTYKDISDSLFVSLNTVRSHVKSIYSKLGAENRTKALEQARALGII